MLQFRPKEPFSHDLCQSNMEKEIPSLGTLLDKDDSQTLKSLKITST
jgi:hypothetical protein